MFKTGFNELSDKRYRRRPQPLALANVHDRKMVTRTWLGAGAQHAEVREVRRSALPALQPLRMLPCVRMLIR